MWKRNRDGTMDSQGGHTPSQWKNRMIGRVNRKRVIQNEEGSVLVLGLLMVVLLTVLGMAATRTSTIEIQIAGNERDYRENFYRAEGAAKMAAQLLHNLTADQRGNPAQINWLNAIYSTDIGDPDNWDETTSQVAIIDPNTRYAAVEESVAGSLDMGAKHHLWDYSVYGFHDSVKGRVMIQLGCREWKANP